MKRILSLLILTVMSAGLFSAEVYAKEPINLYWEGYTAHWTAPEDCDGVYVTLYIEGYIMVALKFFDDAAESSYDFTEFIEKHGSNVYHFKVQALYYGENNTLSMTEAFSEKITVEEHVCNEGELQSGIPATCGEPGVKDSYRCSCGKLYLEEDCRTLVSDEKDLFLPASGAHKDEDQNHQCDICNADLGIEKPEEPEEPDESADSDRPADKRNEAVPKTGDTRSVGLWSMMMMVSLMTMVTVYVMKKNR